jgi:hypothetical protein
MPFAKRVEMSLWTPDLMEFAVSPQVGQAVLAFARFHSSSGPKFSAGGQASTACPTCEALAIERNGSAHFPRANRNCGRHQESRVSTQQAGVPAPRKRAHPAVGSYCFRLALISASRFAK